MLLHHAPFGHNRFAHLARLAGAGHVVHNDRNLLTDVFLQVFDLSIVGSRAPCEFRNAILSAPFLFLTKGRSGLFFLRANLKADALSIGGANEWVVNPR